MRLYTEVGRKIVLLMPNAGEDLFLKVATLNALSSVTTNWLIPVQLSWQTDSQVQQLISDWTQGTTTHPGYLWEHGVLTHKGCLVVGASIELRNNIIEAYHNSLVGGHSRIEKTTKRIQRTFYWRGLKRDVQKFIS